ncbi:MAG: oligosaccharide flippase family protein [Paracoccus sp. (in: a-proteobacteria)]
MTTQDRHTTRPEGSTVPRSLAFTIADKASGMVLSITTMAIVSRILSPAEIGVFLVGSGIIVLIEAFRDFGVATYLIQAREMTAQLFRTAVTIMALLSAALAAAIFVLADVLAGFYDSAELAQVIHIALLAFIVAPIGNPLLALLRRRMQFGRVALIGMAAGATNAITSMGLAFAGYGMFSLAWASVLAAGVSALGAVIATRKLPSFRPSLAEWRVLLPFGAWSSIVTLLGMMMEALPRLILGRMLGFEMAGLFARSVALSQLPERLFLSAVQPVVLPAMAARLRMGDSVAAPYLLGTSWITGLQWPMLAMIALLATPLVSLLLGEQWTGVVPLLRIVALSSLFLFPQYLAFPVLVAAGRVRLMAVASAITLPVSGLIMIFAAHWGLREAALSLFIIAPFQGLIMLHVTHRCIRFGWGNLLGVLCRSGLVAAMTAAPAAAVLLWQAGTLDAGLGPGALASVAGLLGWMVGLKATGHPIGARLGVLSGRLRLLRTVPQR